MARKLDFASFATSVGVSAVAGGLGYVIEETMNSRSENITINKVLGHAGVVAFEGAYSFFVGGLTGSMYNAGTKGSFLSKEWLAKFIIGQEFSQPIKIPLDMLRNNLWG